MCKPTKCWDQGGYDVVRIKKTPPSSPAGGTKENDDDDGTDKIRLDLLFGQVVKSLTPSLNLELFEHLANVFVAAGYDIGSIEIAFIVPAQQVDTFTLASSAVTGSGRLVPHVVHGSPTAEKWAYQREHEQVVVYGLAW